MTKALKIAAPLAIEHLVRKVNNEYYDQAGIRNCVNFSETSHIKDASVTVANLPVGTHNKPKPWFSGKHHLYCLKSKISIPQ